MIRKLLLGLSILAVIAAPLPAWARAGQGHDVHGHPVVQTRPAFHDHARFVRPPVVVSPFVGVYAAPYVAAPFCGWQPGYWAQQSYTDVYGNSTVVPQWVPPLYVCS